MKTRKAPPDGNYFYASNPELCTMPLTENPCHSEFDVVPGVGGDIGAILDQPYCSESARTLVVCSGEKAGDIRANRGET